MIIPPPSPLSRPPRSSPCDISQQGTIVHLPLSLPPHPLFPSKWLYDGVNRHRLGRKDGRLWLSVAYSVAFHAPLSAAGNGCVGMAVLPFGTWIRGICAFLVPLRAFGQGEHVGVENGHVANVARLCRRDRLCGGGSFGHRPWRGIGWQAKAGLCNLDSIPHVATIRPMHGCNGQLPSGERCR